MTDRNPEFSIQLLRNMDLLLHNLRTGGIQHDDWSVAREAADEIERLRGVLQSIADHHDSMMARAVTDNARRYHKERCDYALYHIIKM